MTIQEWLTKNWLTVLMAALLITLLWLGGSALYDEGHAAGSAEGREALAQFKLEQEQLRAEASEQSLAQLREQVSRANAAEAALLSAQSELDKTRGALKERIAHVSKTYKPSRSAAPVAVPVAVFTCGWLRDYNAAAGADLPAPAACRATAGAAETAWPAAGSDAELLASGVSPADILAHIQDYGLWSKQNLSQLGALIELLEKKEAP
jgi:hypothetical protein